MRSLRKPSRKSPYHIDENGNIVNEDFIETYFDISSAEVKAAGFASGDPDLIDKFNKGEDIYVYSAKLYLGDKFDKLDEKDKKMWRKRSIWAVYSSDIIDDN